MIRPIHDYILVKKNAKSEKSAGGIYLAPSVRELINSGTVIATGPGAFSATGTKMAMSLTVGQTVLFRTEGQPVKYDGEDYILMREVDVMAVVD